MECVRCLRPVTVPLALQVTEEFLPVIDLPTGAPLPIEAEPDAPRLTDHHELDLTTRSARRSRSPSRSPRWTGRTALACASSAASR